METIFNIIREVADKSNCITDKRLMEKFNYFIDLHQLREIKKCGSKCTWTNKQTNPILSNIDRILESTEWENQYPRSSAWCKLRVGSDHWSLFLDSGEHIKKRQKYFFFESNWFLQEGLEKMLSEIWEKVIRDMKLNDYSLNKWHGGLCKIR